MVERSDITVIQQLDPRVAEIASPSTEIIMQDYVDTMRVLEDDFVNMGFDALINASGKEDLGGGVLVAITVQERNVQLAFQPRTDTAVDGTVTTGSGAPNAVNRQTFTDTSADFITAGVVPGSYAVNWTDRSVADVVRVIDADTIELRALSNGSDNLWEVGDDYSIWNVVQVRTSGGNLVAIDENGVAIPAILPTWGTQVILTTSSSATIQELSEIQFLSFQNVVTVDEINGSAGTTYPLGIPTNPVNNFADALTIADVYGFNKFQIIGDATVDIGPDFMGKEFIGENTTKTMLTIPAGATVDDCVYRDAALSGTLDGDSRAVECEIASLDMVHGILDRCILASGTTTLGGSMDGTFIDCVSKTGIATPPIIDMGGSGQDLYVRGFRGELEVRNLTGANEAQIGLDGAELELDSTMTAGSVVVRGVGQVTDNTGMGTTVDDQTVGNENTAEAIWDALIANHNVTGSFGEFITNRLLTAAKFFGMRKQ